ncbi:MAG: nuclear transport factor 2 family protein [Ginsengibacter sp.]
MEKQSMQIVTRFLTAVQNGDNEKLNTILDDNIQWDQPGNNSISGIKKTKAEVFDMVGKMFAFSNNTLRLLEIKSISANANSVAAVLLWKASKPGTDDLEVTNIDVYEIADGKIITAKVYSADVEKENSFWK